MYGLVLRYRIDALRDRNSEIFAKFSKFLQKFKLWPFQRSSEGDRKNGQRSGYFEWLLMFRFFERNFRIFQYLSFWLETVGQVLYTVISMEFSFFL